MISQGISGSSAQGIAPEYARFIMGIIDNHFVRTGVISHHDAISGFGLGIIVSGLLSGVVFLVGILCFEIIQYILRRNSN